MISLSGEAISDLGTFPDKGTRLGDEIEQEEGVEVEEEEEED